MSTDPDKEIDQQRFVFIVATILLISLIGWWISLQISQTQDILSARIEKLKSVRAEAWLYDSSKVLKYYEDSGALGKKDGSDIVIVSKLPTELQSRKERIADIAAKFPDVQIVPKPMAADDPPLLDMFDAYLTSDQSKLENLERERVSVIWKAALQSGAMAIGILTGLIMIYNKLNDELDLKLRQKNFLDAVTHELKTPIASIRIWTETLFSKSLKEEQLAKISFRMNQDLTRLSDLVGNLLVVARGEAGELSSNPQLLNLSESLSRILSTMDQKLGPGNLGLAQEIQEDIYVKADPEQIEIIIENLLSNAFKYADSPRTTEVQLKVDKSRAILTISDQGYGIHSQNLTKIFDKFYRSGEEMTRRVPGTGLGLFLVKQMVELNGGSVKVTSKGPDQGSTFTISLPCAEKL
ncbi:MAG: sensor histidine kinase [Holophagaceae bacterium]